MCSSLSSCNIPYIVIAIWSLSCIQLFCHSMDSSPPCSSVYGNSQEEYWSGLPFPSPGDLQEDRSSNPFQYSCLGNPMDVGAWQAITHGVAKSWIRQQLLVLGEHPISGSFFPKLCFFNKISKRCIHVFRCYPNMILEKNPEPRGSLVSAHQKKCQEQINSSNKLTWFR